MSVDALVLRIADTIIDPLLVLLSAVGTLVFVFGLVEFLLSLNGYGERKEDGKRHMFWGLIGMFVMFSAWGILTLIANTVCSGGLQGCSK